MRIALVQLASGTDPSANLAAACEAITDAATRGAELVVLPEATMCSFARPRPEVAEPVDGPWSQAITELADRLGVTVVVGIFTATPSGRVRNTLLARGPMVHAHYDKLHLFDALGYRESDQIEAGDQVVTFDVDGGTIGLATCYDLRFPELFRELARAGATLILCPSSWAPGPGKLDQWRALAVARALDSTSVLVAVDQAEQPWAGHGNRPTGIGHSVVVSAEGQVLTELGNGPDLQIVDVDLDQVEAVRRRLPVLDNARFMVHLRPRGAPSAADRL